MSRRDNWVLRQVAKTLAPYIARIFEEDRRFLATYKDPNSRYMFDYLEGLGRVKHIDALSSIMFVDRYAKDLLYLLQQNAKERNNIRVQALDKLTTEEKTELGIKDE